MAEHGPPQYSHWLTIATTIFLIWALMFACIRIWGKVTRNLSWALNDSVFSAAFVFGIAECSAIYVATKSNFAELATPTDSSYTRLPQLKALFTSQILYVLTIGLSRTSGALFIGALTRSTRQKGPSLVVAIICGAWTVGSVLAIAIQGDLQAPWKIEVGSEILYKRWLGIEISGLCLEVMIWSLSLTLVWGLQMRLARQIKVSSLFGCRLIIIGIVAGRLYFLDPSNDSRSPYGTTLSYILTQAAMQYSLMSECMTCLKPFLQPFHSDYGISVRHDLSYDSEPSPGHTELSKIPNTQRRLFSKETKASQRSMVTHLEEKNLSLAEAFGGRGSVMVSVEAQSAHPRQQRSDDEEEIELLQQGRMVIQQTTTLHQIEETAGEPTPSLYSKSSSRRKAGSEV